MTSELQDKKGERTRKQIVRAARKVFSRYPYHIASMRMIGKEAGVEHPLISYYFPNKARLFETILGDICDDLIIREGEWFDAVIDLNITKAFAKYVDLMLDFNLNDPEPMRILALNIIQSEDFSQMPGYNHIMNYIDRLSKVVEEKLSLRGNYQDLKMYIHSLSLLTISMMGASQSVASVQGLNGDSDEYREMVKSTLCYIFIPRLRDIMGLPVAKKKKTGNQKSPA